MNLHELRMFTEVVRQGRFSGAASAVHATQSTVSKAVKHLEDEAGMRLLERHPKGVRLTLAGRTVHRHAVELLARSNDLKGELDELKGLKRGVLRLGVPVIGSEVLFAAPLAEYRRRYPGIELQIDETGSQTLQERVLAGELDLGGCLLPAAPKLAWRELRKEPIDAILAADHPFGQSRGLRFADLAGIPFILYAAGFAMNPFILAACRKNRFTPRIAAQTSQTGLAAALAAAGLGVAFMPRMIAERLLDQGVRNVPIADPPIFWHMALVWRRDAYLSAEARAWLGILDEMPRG